MTTGVPRPSDPPAYLAAHLEEALACNPRVSELGLHVAIAGDHVFVDGVVSTAQRRHAISLVVDELLPGYELHNHATVAEYRERPDVEVLG